MWCGSEGSGRGGVGTYFQLKKYLNISRSLFVVRIFLLFPSFMPLPPLPPIIITQIRKDGDDACSRVGDCYDAFW